MTDTSMRAAGKNEGAAMRWQLKQIDQVVIDTAQWAYDLTLDHLDVKIGTFRMTLAIMPIMVDLVVRSLRGFFFVQASTTAIFLLVLFSMFYNIKTMKVDNSLQARNNLKAINVVACQFQARTFTTRMFYLGFFSLSAAVYHDLAGIGLISIVFTRCIKVRARIAPEPRHALSLHPA